MLEAWVQSPPLQTKGPAKWRSHEAQFQMLLHLFQEVANSCFLRVTGPVITEPCLWLFLTESHKSNILHLGKGRASPLVWQWVSPALSDFGGPTDARESSWSCLATKDLATFSMSFVRSQIIDYSRRMMRQFLLCLFLFQLLSLIQLVKVWII
jgi:hypothetical protein